MRKHLPLFILLAAYAFLLHFFPLKMQAIESYQYSAAAEGFYNLTTTFQTAQPENKLPDFSRFHPNHPLLHALAGFLHGVTRIPALEVFKFFNFIASLASLALFYFICLTLWVTETAKARRKAGKVVAVAATALMAGSHAFYMAALSGEVHLVALAFFLAAVYSLLRSFLVPEEHRDRYLLWAAVWAAFALAFHLIVIFVLPAGLAVFWSARGRNRWRVYLFGAAIVVLAFVLVYVALLVYVLGIDSVRQYMGTFFVYKFLVHVRYTGLEWYWVFVKSWAYVIVYNFFSVSLVLQLAIAALFSMGCFNLFRAKNPRPVKALLVLWPVSYLGMHLVLGSRADSVNYWHFALPGVFAITGYAFLSLYRHGFLRSFVYVLPAAVFFVNFFSAVYPNAKLSAGEYLFVGNPRDMLSAAGISLEINNTHKVGILTKDPVLTFAEIYNLGSRFGFRNQDLFIYCCGKRGYEASVRKWIADNESFFFIVDAPGDEVPKMLTEAGKKFRLVREADAEIPENWVTAALYFTRPDGYRILKRIRVFFVDPRLSPGNVP